MMENDLWWKTTYDGRRQPNKWRQAKIWRRPIKGRSPKKWRRPTKWRHVILKGVLYIRGRWFSKNFPDFFGHERVFMSDWNRMNMHISRSQKGLFTLAQISVFKWTHLLKRKYSRFWYNSLYKIFNIKTKVSTFLCDWIEYILYDDINQFYKNDLEQTSK